MRNILLSLILSFSLSSASIIGANFNQYDLQILEDLDVDSSFITDYKLQKIYNKLLSQTKSNYIEKLNDASLFVPKIKEILKKNSIPPAFLYMAMAESAFAIDAKSRMRATGLWQFMSGTAKIYGLKNDLYIDERMDFVKSTIAATNYLKHLHKQFGKWYLAAIAYNCGEGRVIEGLTRATIDMYCEENPSAKKTKKIKEFRRIIRDYQKKRVKFNKLYKVYKEVKTWNYKPGIDKLLFEQRGLSRQYIPDESRNYIRKIISLALMSNRNFVLDNSSEYLFNRGISSPIAEVKVKGGTHMGNIAELIGVKHEYLSGLNKHIKQNIIPPEEKEYSIYIPYSKLARFNANINDLKPTKFAVHIVKSGETLGQLGAYYKISYKLIKKFNNLKSHIIGLNQKLIIPIDPLKMPKSPHDYFVKRGDTLASIAKRHDVKLAKLMQDNNIRSSLIHIGDKLVIRYQ